MESNDKFNVVGNKIFLKSGDWGGEKLLGVKTETGVSIKKDRSKHLLRMDQSYGVNKDLLQALEKDSKIRISDGQGTYELPVSTILEQGVERDFGRMAPEPQMFIPLKTWENNKVR